MGGSIPLSFGTGDAGVLPTAAASVVTLSPFQVNRVRLVPDQAAYFVLGGTALPSLFHRPGQYSARVVVIVTQPGT